MKIRAGFLVGYNGKNYHGLQLNGTMKTIERALGECLVEAKAISDKNAEDFSKIHLKSASRTDKGVHAAMNMIAVKIEHEITEEFINKMRDLLKNKNINLYKIIKLTKSTIPAKQAMYRLYEYVVPTYFLKEDDFTKDVEDLKKIDLKNEKKLNRTYAEEDIESIIGYRASQVDIDKFIEILKNYEGTKNYHNFTNSSNTRGASRYIKSITVTDPYIIDDVEYVRIVLHGQSFLLHQIRKMVLFAVLLCKYNRENIDEKITLAFGNESMHIPKSPAEYLFLYKPVFFPLRRDKGVFDPIEVDEDLIEGFKETVLLPEIHKKENLYAFLASLDAVKFHNDNMMFLKNC